MTVGNRARFFGLNLVGLRRRGFSRGGDRRPARRPTGCSSQGRPQHLARRSARLEAEGPAHRRGPRRCVDFIRASKRGVVLQRRRGAAADEDGGLSGVATAGEPLGLIAGNGRFPFLAAAGARRAGRRVVALAIREEADPELEAEVDELHWVGLGQLGRGDRDPASRPGAREAVMAGQVKHRQIFSDIVPDLKLLGVLARLALPEHRQPDRGRGRRARRARASRCCPRWPSSADQLAIAGADDPPAARPRASGATSSTARRVARTLAGMDLGQTAVVKDRAAVALEAMEGTDETIRRAGRIAGPGTTVVKVSKPRQDMRFDVPVVGAGTLEAMREAGSRVLALDAGRTLLIDRPAFLARADADGVAVSGLEPGAGGGERRMSEGRCGRASSGWGRSAGTTPGCGRALAGARASSGC